MTSVSPKFDSQSLYLNVSTRVATTSGGAPKPLNRNRSCCAVPVCACRHKYYGTRRTTTCNRNLPPFTPSSEGEKSRKSQRSASDARLARVPVVGCKQNELWLFALPACSEGVSTEVAVSPTSNKDVGGWSRTLPLFIDVSLSHCYCGGALISARREDFLVETLNLDIQLIDLSRGSSLNPQLRRGHQ